ncbi:hypothetical protein AAZX31_06G204300 [Glycine max]|nr:hypothetical protein GLYMA_06G217050v4 [Glycine max]KAH1127027.1 hypothetical protein GYH30_015853 [Glycine max]
MFFYYFRFMNVKILKKLISSQKETIILWMTRLCIILARSGCNDIILCEELLGSYLMLVGLQ